ncbi:hypothetical protein ACS126_13105 [Sphingobacterium lactis]|uniref:hypothetical protein n=1 Tax=Sphingobacterium lactis TaxID=797291 RepID=UPI003EC7C897
MKYLNRLYILLVSTMLLSLGACDKNDEKFFYDTEATSILIKGYNGSNENLEVQIDTFKFKSLIAPNENISQTEKFIFTPDQASAKLLIKEKSTGKIILEKELKKGESQVEISVPYFDGKLLTVTPPAADPNINKVGLYIINKENNDLADIWLVDENLSQLTVFGKNIAPNKWVFLDVDYTTTLTNYPFFYKAGSLGAEDEGYFKNNMWSSYLETNPFFPTDGSKGQVRSFVIIYDEAWGQPLTIQI